jgi:hypothetical protein
MKEKWYVRLGRPEWLRFTYARNDNDPLKLIGSVQRGPQIGALAVDGEQFYQVNGDFVRRLNPYHLRKAVNRAKAFENHHPPDRPSRGMSLKPVTTTPEIKFKRRRVFTITD